MDEANQKIADARRGDRGVVVELPREERCMTRRNGERRRRRLPRGARGVRVREARPAAAELAQLVELYDEAEARAIEVLLEGKLAYIKLSKW